MDYVGVKMECYGGKMDCDGGKMKCNDSKQECDDGKQECDDGKQECDDGKQDWDVSTAKSKAKWQNQQQWLEHSNKLRRVSRVVMRVAPAAALSRLLPHAAEPAANGNTSVEPVAAGAAASTTSHD